MRASAIAVGDESVTSTPPRRNEKAAPTASGRRRPNDAIVHSTVMLYVTSVSNPVVPPWMWIVCAPFERGDSMIQ